MRLPWYTLTMIVKTAAYRESRRAPKSNSGNTGLALYIPGPSLRRKRCPPNAGDRKFSVNFLLSVALLQKEVYQ
jgi:hypothetical protein